jgi:hypothetical protein
VVSGRERKASPLPSHPSSTTSILTRVPDVQASARGVGEHVQHIGLGFASVQASHVRGAEGAVGLPAGLPLGLDGGEGVGGGAARGCGGGGGGCVGRGRRRDRRLGRDGGRGGQRAQERRAAAERGVEVGRGGRDDGHEVPSSLAPLSSPRHHARRPHAPRQFDRRAHAGARRGGAGALGAHAGRRQVGEAGQGGGPRREVRRTKGGACLAGGRAQCALSREEGVCKEEESRRRTRSAPLLPLVPRPPLHGAAAASRADNRRRGRRARDAHRRCARAHRASAHHLRLSR